MSRENLKDLAVALCALLMGFVGAWLVYQHFAQFESGELPSMKLWAPLAMIYNLGGYWTVVAKWATLGLLLLWGLLGLWLTYEALKVIGKAKEKSQSADRPPATLLHVRVTSEQLAARADIIVDGPRGPVTVRIPAGFSDVRLQNLGQREGQDLLIRFMRKTLP